MKIFEDTVQNLYVYIYTHDHKPAHVHIFKGRKKDSNEYEVKINIGGENEPPIIVSRIKIKDSDVKAAWQLVAANQEEFLAKWNEIHGIQRLEKPDK